MRHRIVQAGSPRLLGNEVMKFVKEGWRLIGEAAFVAPLDSQRPPYWFQAMYLASDEVPLETVKVADFSKGTGASKA